MRDGAVLELGRRRAPRAPSPPSDPLIGHYRRFTRDPLAFLLETRRSCGDVVEARFAHIHAFLLSHPDYVRHVLQDNNRAYSKDTRGFNQVRLIVGNGLLTSEGSFWLRQRRIAQPAFHKRRIHGFGRTMVRAAEDMAERWTPSSASGEPFDVHEEMMRVTLRIAGETLLGSDPSAQAETVGESFSFLQQSVNRRVRRLVRLPLSVPTPRNRRTRRHLASLDRIVLDMIDRRRHSDEPHDDLLQMLLEARDEETGEGMTDAQLRDEAMTMFLAGHETTANALAWTFYLLSLHPDVDRRLAEELDRVLGGRAPTVDDLPQLPWTKQVVQESMRLYPPAWMLGRACAEPDEVGGYPIPAGCLVFMSPWVVHRHPDFWDNPAGFDPERFAPEPAQRRPRFAYFPFGGGPRQCIGNAFALVEAQLVLATVAQRYRLELVPGAPVTPMPLITLRPHPALPMTPRPRPS